MSELKIIAVITAKAEYKDEVLNAIHKVVDETRLEEGNISYDLHTNINKPLDFIIFEIWKSEEAIQIHNSSDHFKEFAKKIDGKIDQLKIDTIKQIY